MVGQWTTSRIIHRFKRMMKGEGGTTYNNIHHCVYAQCPNSFDLSNS